MNRFLAVLWGAVIAAAFLGPGTVTTAAKAGATHRFALLWALIFATVACLVLQEASARLTVVSGRNLGEALRFRFGGGARAHLVLWSVVVAVVLGCAAYEAGNILGGVAGAELFSGASKVLLTVASAVAAALLLGWGSTRQVVNVLSLLVAGIGAAFLVTAISLGPPLREVLAGLALPRIPSGSGLLVLGLIGTTVVPYNLFLGSGLARGQRLSEMRFGLTVAIGLGGLISMAVVVVGSAVAASDFGYQSLAAVLAERLGPWAEPLFGMGLFAAGFSSAITAPLAAAITARSLFAKGADDPAWHERSWRYRAVWGGVLLVGLTFGVSGVKPIPAIILAQALNGLLLPLVAIFLLLAVNERRLMGEAGLNGMFSNAVMSLVVVITVILGARGVIGAATSALGLAAASERTLLGVGAIVLAVLVVPVVRWVRSGRAA